MADIDRRSEALEVAQPWEGDRCSSHSTRWRQPHLQTDSQHNDRNLATRRHREVRRFCRRTTPAMGTCRGETIEGSRNRKRTRLGNPLLNWKSTEKGVESPFWQKSHSNRSNLIACCEARHSCNRRAAHQKNNSDPVNADRIQARRPPLLSPSRPGHGPGIGNRGVTRLDATQELKDSSKHTGLIPKMIQEGSAWFWVAKDRRALNRVGKLRANS